VSLIAIQSYFTKISTTLDIEDIGGGKHDALMDELFQGMTDKEIEQIYQEASGEAVDIELKFGMIHTII